MTARIDIPALVEQVKEQEPLLRIPAEPGWSVFRDVDGEVVTWVGIDPAGQPRLLAHVETTEQH